MLFVCFVVQVSSANATTISQPILQLSGDSQTQVAQVAPGQDLNAAAGQTLQSVQLVNPGTFLIQAQTVTATGQIQWQTFQVSICRVQDISFSPRCQMMFNLALCVGSGCPVTAGASVASGTGSGPAAHLSPSPDPPSGPSGTGQLAQPADCHGELCVTRSSVHTRRGSQESSWCVSPPKILFSEDKLN